MKVIINKDSSVWLTYDNGEVIFGAENINVLREHFKDSLKIDDNLKATIIDHDRFLSDRVFL